MILLLADMYVIVYEIEKQNYVNFSVRVSFL